MPKLLCNLSPELCQWCSFVPTHEPLKLSFAWPSFCIWRETTTAPAATRCLPRAGSLGSSCQLMGGRAGGCGPNRWWQKRSCSATCAAPLMPGQHGIFQSLGDKGTSLSQERAPAASPEAVPSSSTRVKGGPGGMQRGLLHPTQWFGNHSLTWGQGHGAFPAPLDSLLDSGSPLTWHFFPAQRSCQLRALLVWTDRLSLPRFAYLSPSLWARPCNPTVFGLCLLLLPSCTERNATKPLGDESKGRWCDMPAQKDGTAALRAASHPSHPYQPSQALPKIPALPRWRTWCPELWRALHLISTRKHRPCKRHGQITAPAETREHSCSGPTAAVPGTGRSRTAAQPSQPLQDTSGAGPPAA